MSKRKLGEVAGVIGFSPKECFLLGKFEQAQCERHLRHTANCSVVRIFLSNCRDIPVCSSCIVKYYSEQCWDYNNSMQFKQCASGHHICDDCLDEVKIILRTQNKQCPTCRCDT